MNDNVADTIHENSDEITLIAFKFGESPFPMKSALLNDTSGKVISIAWLFFLISYKEYNILVDTGVGDPGAFSKYGFQVNQFREPVLLLKEYGLSPDEITDVIITHSDFDHIGDINRYQNANIYIQSNEYEICKEMIKNREKVITFNDSVIVHDLFEIKHIGGHTIGSSIVSFKHGESEYILAGDECYIHESIVRQIPTSRSYNREKSREFVEKYGKPDYVALFCHEPGIVEGDAGYKAILPGR